MYNIQYESGYRMSLPYCRFKIEFSISSSITFQNNLLEISIQHATHRKRIEQNRKFNKSSQQSFARLAL